MKINIIPILTILSVIGLLTSCTKTEKIYYDAGELKIVAEINSDSLWDGNVKQYYENGVLEFNGIYVNGYKNGLANWYSTDGKLAKTEYYLQDTLNGIVSFYDSLGYKYFEYDYVKGKDIGYRHYDSLGNITGQFVYLDTLNLPAFSDVQIKFDRDTNSFYINDTIGLDIKIPGISKNQLAIGCTNSITHTRYLEDNFMFSIIPARSGELKLYVFLKVNNTKRVTLGMKTYTINE